MWAISHQITMSSVVILGNVLGYSFYEVEEVGFYVVLCFTNLYQFLNNVPCCKKAFWLRKMPRKGHFVSDLLYGH